MQETEERRCENTATIQCRVRACICTCVRVRGGRGRDVLEAREAVEHRLRERGKIIVLQPEPPADGFPRVVRLRMSEKGEGTDRDEAGSGPAAGR